MTVFGEYVYDNVIVFAPGARDIKAISTDILLEFLEHGGNLLVAVNEKVSDYMRSFIGQLGVEFDVKDSKVVDHFAFDTTLDKSLDHSTIQLGEAALKSSVLSKFYTHSSPVLYKGIGHSFESDNILVYPALSGNPSTYSAVMHQDIKAYPENVGTDTLLVSAIQGRNNARIIVSGSIDMFSNEFFSSTIASTNKQSGNQLYCQALSKWGFAESGVLRFRDITHTKEDGTPPDVILHEKERPDLPVSLYPDPEITSNSLVYRIKDMIVYTMIVEELVNDNWKPFVADDMQLEFVMLDPYVRRTMAVDEKTGKYSVCFMAPDSYGVYKFRVLYRRTGYSVLHAETTVSIRPFKHNEYERFIISAYPYYTSAFSAMIAFFSFFVVFLYSDFGKKDKTEKAKKTD